LLHDEQGDMESCHRLVQAWFDSKTYIERRRAFTEKRLPMVRGI
jgi:hypothetical protein